LRLRPVLDEGGRSAQEMTSQQKMKGTPFL